MIAPLLLLHLCIDRKHGGPVCGDIVDTFGTISSRDFTHDLKGQEPPPR